MGKGGPPHRQGRRIRRGVHGGRDPGAALFNANLLPKGKDARNITLAAFGRADKKVNQNLALKCWKNNGRSTGTGGKLTVAYVEGFGENVYRQISKMEFILQALTYPQIGKIIYTSAHSDLTQAHDRLPCRDLTARQRHRHLPRLRRRDAARVQGGDEGRHSVATYAWGFVSGPGKNYTTVVGEDTCRLGKAYAAS